MKKENLTKQAIEGSFWHGITTLTQRVGGLIFTIILARLLLPEGFGLYNLAISVTTIFFMFQAGIDKTLGRYISEAFKDKNKENAYFRYISKIKIIFLLIISLALVIAAYPLSVYILKKPVLFIPLLLAAIYTFFISLEQFFISFFLAIKKVKYNAINEIIYQSLRVILIFAAFSLIYSKPTINHTFFVLILSSLVSFLFLFFSMRYLSPHLLTGKNKISNKEKKRVTHFVGYFTLVTLSLLFFVNIDTIMIGLLIPDVASIGIYKSASLIILSIAGMIMFSSVLLPFFVQLEDKDLEKAFNKVFRYLMIISIPATVGLAVLGKYFIVLIYGYEYLNAALPLYFLSPLIVFLIQVDLYRELFSAKEKPKDTLFITLFVILLDIILNYLLINYFLSYSTALAITGAALATLISVTVYVIGLAILARQKLHLKTNTELIIKPLISAFIMALILYFLKNYMGDINLLKGIFLVIVGIVAYFLSMLIIKGFKTDDYLIISHLGNKLKEAYNTLRRKKQKREV